MWRDDVTPTSFFVEIAKQMSLKWTQQKICSLSSSNIKKENFNRKET